MYSSSPVVTYTFGYEGSLIKETNNNLAYVHRIINKKTHVTLILFSLRKQNNIFNSP